MITYRYPKYSCIGWHALVYAGMRWYALVCVGMRLLVFNTITPLSTTVVIFNLSYQPVLKHQDLQMFGLKSNKCE